MKTVLIIEDHPDHAFIIQRYVVDCGFLTATCTDPFLAIKLIKTGGIDIIITDLLMPIMSGIELIKYVRLIDDKIPIIVVTAYCSEQHQLNSINAGANHFVCKPIDRQTIKDLIVNMY